nr:MAG TPA: hypothetical protein [Bacteriophage sp.]
MFPSRVLKKYFMGYLLNGGHRKGRSAAARSNGIIVQNWRLFNIMVLTRTAKNGLG